jgi:hypothetical protein
MALMLPKLGRFDEMYTVTYCATLVAVAVLLPKVTSEVREDSVAVALMFTGGMS